MSERAKDFLERLAFTVAFVVVGLAIPYLTGINDRGLFPSLPGCRSSKPLAQQVGDPNTAGFHRYRATARVTGGTTSRARRRARRGQRRSRGLLMSRRTAVDFRGVRVSKHTRNMVLGLRSGPGFRFHIAQGSWSGAAASAGTHTGPGAIDIGAAGLSKAQRVAAVHALKTPGSRPGIADRSPDSGDHISTASRSVRNARRGTGAEGFLRPPPRRARGRRVRQNVPPESQGEMGLPSQTSCAAQVKPAVRFDPHEPARRNRTAADPRPRSDRC